ncbi:FBP domain-containing protein [Streptomyces sp. DSM 44915]|uniref:FBP domain-containing protein n=1 Tax=Streptomyces chisholmiae TaxID=3075540 RepID=A0ABU2JNT0_9ACTN|nr:FBP domain-containing protein [Streptomyces sp. DSM 44915]MDT0266652.1 FBP domain-containing protein [Streptomyces sp. DSM 44915]
MKPLSEPEIRASFVNCSKGAAKRLFVPHDLAERPWDDLDFLGWRDPQAPDRAYLVAELDGRPRAVALRGQGRGAWGTRRGMCSLCLTAHTGGVSLLVAPRAGRAGQQGNSVGAYVCDDLCCPLYVRGRKETGSDARLRESITVEEKIDRMMTNLTAFLAKVTDRSR